MEKMPSVTTRIAFSVSVARMRRSCRTNASVERCRTRCTFGVAAIAPWTQQLWAYWSRTTWSLVRIKAVMTPNPAAHPVGNKTTCGRPSISATACCSRNMTEPSFPAVSAHRRYASRTD